jgi:hypothetical protein
MNAEWHAKNKMPAKPTLAQRVDWHKAHAKACACRPMPDSIRSIIGASVNGRRIRAKQ